MINIIHEDDHILVVNKPSGLLCVPGLSHPDNLFDQVKSYNPNARTIHRLDMGTSGLVVFGLHYDAQKAMSKLFELRKVQKKYIARIIGVPNVNAGEIHSPLICDWPNRPKQMVDWLNGKPASTYFKVLSSQQLTLQSSCTARSRESNNQTSGSRELEFKALTTKQTTLVELKPITGRTHQLRVHMLQIGHPILGDHFYNIDNSDKLADRLLLHAKILEFTHPITHNQISLCADVDF